MMKKIKAALIHFSLSLLLFSLVMWFFVLRWYPLPYFWADGAWMGVRIAALVDVVLGPLLTLIIYQQGKKYLKLDLSLIALVQVSALIWGLYNIYQVRPIFVVFGNVGGQSELHTVIIDQIEVTIKSPEALDALTQNNPYTPALVFTKVPQNLSERGEYFHGGIYYLQTDRYQPYSDTNLDEALQHGLPRSFFDKLEQVQKKKFEHFLAKHDNHYDDYSFIPLHCHFESLILIFDKKQRRAVDYLNIPINYDNKNVSENEATTIF